MEATMRVRARFLAGLSVWVLAATASGLPPQKPEIEFRALLIIKRASDTYSPLFLPVRSRMTEDEVARARRCFEVETPDMVRDVTGGRVRFVPTVRVSERPLRVFDPARQDSAEFFAPELLNEMAAFAKPGEFDSAGYYFLHYDAACGYKIPRAGFGVGWYDQRRALGLFAVSCAPNLNPRDEIFLHEWMHGLDGFYGKKAGVTLPKGWLHGPKEHGYQERPWRPEDTFRGWMAWYRDYLNGEVREGEARVGLGRAAWGHGPMRLAATALRFEEEALPLGVYPGWVPALMRGELSQARLGPGLLIPPPAGPVSADSEGWRLDVWNAKAGSAAVADADGALRLENPAPNHAALVRNLPLDPFKNYLLTADVRAEEVAITEKGGRVGVSLQAGDSASVKRLVGTTAWTTVALPFTTGARPETCRLRLALGGTGSVARGRALFRNVQVRAIAYPEEATFRTGGSSAPRRRTRTKRRSSPP